MFNAPNQFGNGMQFGNLPTQFAIGMNWVSSAAEAERLELPPGGTAVFFDKVNDGMMYIRTRDSYNIYNTRIFNYNEVQPKQPDSPYVTRTELEQMFQKFLGGASNDTLRTNDGEISTGNSAATNQSRNGDECQKNDGNVRGGK